MKFFVRAVLVLSLALNAFFIYDRSGRPDVDFYGTGIKNAYFIKQHEKGDIYDGNGDYFVIEHRDSDDNTVHRYMAKCQPALTWSDGVTKPGKPMSDTCIYLSGLVGKSIAGGKMRKEGNTLVYVPWADSDTVQTADVLTIISDEKLKALSN